MKTDLGTGPPATRCPFVRSLPSVARRPADSEVGDLKAAPARSPLRSVTARLLSWTSRTLITAGILTLLFAAFEVWGTAYLEARSQRALRAEFGAQLAERAESPGVGDDEGSAPAPVPPPAPGDPVAMIKIPRIGLERTVVEGVAGAQLEQGPGHYPETAMPGHAGNAAIAGHRTTWGAPFLELDRLQPGDEIIVEAAEGRFVYRVAGQRIVSPHEVSVLAPTEAPSLTLTTCNPQYSARERLIVSAELVGDPVARSLGPPRASGPEVTTVGPRVGLAEATAVLAASNLTSGELTSSGGFGHADGSTLRWGFAVLAVGLLWWWAFRRRRRYTTWLAGALPFAVVLLPFFLEISRLLPSNF